MHTMVTIVKTTNDVQKAIAHFHEKGYPAPNLYVLAYRNNQQQSIKLESGVDHLGKLKDGAYSAIANVIRGEADELGARMRAMGMAERNAEHLIYELQNEKLVVIAWGGSKAYNARNEDPEMIYIPGLPYIRSMRRKDVK